MPQYTVEKIVETTHYRKDNTEMRDPHGELVWRVTVLVKEMPGTPIIGFLSWEPGDELLGVHDLKIKSKEWEGGVVHNFWVNEPMGEHNRNASVGHQNKELPEHPANRSSALPGESERRITLAALHAEADMLCVQAEQLRDMLSDMSMDV